MSLRRRDFISLLGGAAVASPLAARAQQPAMPVIGFLNAGSAAAWQPQLTALRGGLKEAGFAEGTNLRIESRFAENQYDRLPGLAADLVQRHVALILASGAVNGPLAAKAATRTIPIVFVTGSDPVDIGLVASLGRPGGNLTGVTLISRELFAKRLELLNELVPSIGVIGLLVNPSNPNTKSEVAELQLLANAGRFRLLVVAASTEADIDAGFATLARQKADAFTIGTDAFFSARHAQVAALAIRHAIPGIYAAREDAAAGGLMSYGSSIPDAYRQAALYIGRILKGDKPADLPVVRPTKFELVINLTAAKVIGLKIPETFLTRADEVIE
jgi:putative ABC transport system substrate-binding protein